MRLIGYGGEWDGPLDLHGMLAMEGLPDQLKEMIPNYPIHILDVRRYGHVENFQTDLKILFEFLQYAADKERISTYIEAKKEENMIIPSEVYDMISLMANIPELEELKEKYADEKGDIVMCKAWEELKEDFREEGVQLALTVIEMSRKKQSESEIAKKCGITIRKVRDILDRMAA